ncbi:hypothetical protein PNOK_0745800 [Pyrrhoderma noxium]|uniref:Uncharacterized protein n=1 Tax=Pyrrhoderma noxium TaxID=2282107 RepID=A0A286UCY8_9AGAM|nr:hypothetical protein PNOK_0745800 [Pyrrhoderma noxium]
MFFHAYPARFDFIRAWALILFESFAFLRLNCLRSKSARKRRKQLVGRGMWLSESFNELGVLSLSADTGLIEGVFNSDRFRDRLGRSAELPYREESRLERLVVYFGIVLIGELSLEIELRQAMHFCVR